MAKPQITTRTGKGVALSYDELDENFTNLRDSVITVSDGTNSTDIDLNGTIQFSAGANTTITENNGVITVAAGSGSLDSDLISVGQADTDVVVIRAEDSQDKGLRLESSYSLQNLANSILIPDSGNIELFSSGTTIGNGSGLTVLQSTGTDLNIANSAGVKIEIDASEIILGDGNDNVDINGTLSIKATGGTPSNTTTPAGWLEIAVGGSNYYLALYS